MGETPADPYEEVDRAAVPKGDAEALEEAVEALAPFAFRSDRQAIEAQDQRQDRRRRVGPVTYMTRNSARKEIIDIAKNFNANVYLAHGAPRLADVQDQLASIAEAAHILSARLRYMTEYTENALLFSGLRDQSMSNEAYGRRLTLVRAAAMDNLRRNRWHVDEVLGLERPPALTERLDALSHLCAAASQSYARFYLADTSGKKDRGGQPTAFTKEQGNPCWTMIVQAAELFEAVNPGRFSGRTGGLFFDFVCRLYDYATDMDSTLEDSQISWRVKKVAARFRRAAKLHREMSVLEEELTRLRKLTANKRNLTIRKRLRRRLNELHRQEIAIARQLDLGPFA